MASSTINYKELWEIVLHGFEPINFKFKIYDAHILKQSIEYWDMIEYTVHSAVCIAFRIINGLYFKTHD